ncbi:hypothetical protein PG994_015369 [Apiospora phragmitis]|uniref:Uncharacterized protein n=1 Tax=Apiospora phragmitis TaxID=2905665 RepID=A0ABR1SRC1_9PEZI
MMASSQTPREATPWAPLGVFNGAMHEFAVHLHNGQAQAQRLAAENVQLQIKLAELLKQRAEMQASRNLQEQLMETQTDLISALESERRRLSPLLQSPTAYQPQTLSPMLESNPSTTACMTEPTLCDMAVEDVSLLAQYGGEPSSHETVKPRRAELYISHSS